MSGCSLTARFTEINNVQGEAWSDPSKIPEYLQGPFWRVLVNPLGRKKLFSICEATGEKKGSSNEEE